MKYGLYIHIPFCLKKCLYCDFASVCADDELVFAYFRALNKELAAYSGKTIDSVFIGGGTPSCVDAQYIYGIFDTINRCMSLERGCEISIETNPGTIDKSKLALYKSCGINRISIGVQSFNDKELAALGRIHNAKQAADAVCLAHNVGFDNVNIDLMLATPYQTPDSLCATLKRAVSLSPSHASAYSLIIEPDTPFYTLLKNDRSSLPDEDTERAMYDFAADFLFANGYEQYEISNFAADGARCLHNLKYWRCMPYIGVGAAAHSYDTRCRYENVRDVAKYIDMMNSCGRAVSDEQILDKSDKITEYIIMAMRLTDGISFDNFRRRFDIDFLEKYGDVIDKYKKCGFLEVKKGAICFTREGFALSNSILCDFID